MLSEWPACECPPGHRGVCVGSKCGTSDLGAPPTWTHEDEVLQRGQAGRVPTLGVYKQWHTLGQIFSPKRHKEMKTFSTIPPPEMPPDLGEDP